MSENTKSIVARADDGTIQVTITIPLAEVKKRQEAALQKLRDEVEVPGFRKGNAPIEKVKERVGENKLLEETLRGILPELFARATEENNLKPIIYPKFELLKANDAEDWQVRAITCEAPTVELGNYKKSLATVSRSKKDIIWTPDKAKAEKDNKKEPTKQELEQEILKKLLTEVPIKIPKILLDQDVDARLSSLLERLEKLGLSLESYLASVGKTAEALRQEYEIQSKESLSLDFILNKIAEEENVEVKSGEVDAAINAAGEAQNTNQENPEQRRFVEAILKRRKALDFILAI